MEPVFRRIMQDEIAEGYQLIVERTDWLNQKGIQQWKRPIPDSIIRQRQAEGHFYGYWVGGVLMAVVCLLEKSILDWGDKLPVKLLCLATLASRLSYAGYGHGSNCVMSACEHARQMGYKKIYLDCVDNAKALPDFYIKLGFRQIGEQVIPSGWRVILMSKDL